MFKDLLVISSKPLLIAFAVIRFFNAKQKFSIKESFQKLKPYIMKRLFNTLFSNLSPYFLRLLFASKIFLAFNIQLII